VTTGQSLSFGAQLREFRLAASLTQEALAERAGISVRAVSDLERGLYQVPHRDTVARLAEALNLTLDEAALLEAAIVRQRGPLGLAQNTRGDDSAAHGALELPTGTVTFLLTEVDGSSRLWERHPELMPGTLQQHDRVIETAVHSHRGIVVGQVMGEDARLAVFQAPPDAVAAAVEIQSRLTAESWPADGRLRVRLALHTGEADVHDGAYYGSALNRCARLRALAAGGQSLLSEAVAESVRAALSPGAYLRDLGEHQLTDHARPEHVHELVAPGIPADFPALRTASPLSKHYDTVVRALIDGRVVLFVGDAVNTSGGQTGSAWRPGLLERPPASNELAAHLALSFDYPAGAAPDLIRIAQYVTTMAGSGPLYEELHALLDPDYSPTPFHQFVAKLPAAIATRGYAVRYPLIVTTNYDHGLELAFTHAGEPFDLVSYVAEGEDHGRFVHHAPDGRARLIDKPNKYLGLSEQRTTIVKLHGAVDHLNAEHDSFVITEDHFLDYLTGGDLYNLVPVTIAAKLRRSHFLFLGYSLRDWNMRVILRRLWGEQRQSYKSWAVHPTPPEPMERGLWRDRGVDVVDVDLDNYVAGLQERVASLPPGNSP
jgi:class 3 adenylate cyclase